MARSIGEALRYIRQSRGLSLDQAAKLAGIRKDVLFRYEAGITPRPNAAMLARLASAYNTTIEQMLSLTLEEPPLYLKRALNSPTLSVLWEENRPLTIEERRILTTLIDLWLQFTKDNLDTLLPPDEREILEQYRAHRDRFLSKPDLELLAAVRAVAALAREPDQVPQPAPAVTPTQAADPGSQPPKKARRRRKAR